MDGKLRVGTFNVENLFSRARVLNLADKQKVTEVLGQVARLEQVLGQAVYNPEDKAAILQASTDLARYVAIRVDSGQLFAGRDGNLRVSANGAGDWSGAVDFVRADISAVARGSTADVIKALKVDVLCTVEVESRAVLQQFNAQALGARQFDYALLMDGNDPRGINVGLLSRLTFGGIHTHMFDADAQGTIFSRDCFDVELRLPDEKPLHVLCNHFKSQSYGLDAVNAARRLRQTKRIAAILAGFDLTKDWVIVAGDLNDAPGSAALQPLLGQPNLYDVLALKFGPHAQQRWTYNDNAQRHQVDYLLVSKPLKAAWADAGVERRGLFGAAGVTPFPSVTSIATAASDHAAVWAEFNL